MSQQLADLLFPDVQKTIADYENEYPQRPTGQLVSRFAPSPTGFLHIGGILTAYVADRLVHQGAQNGILMLRIEDTDQKREVPGAVDMIIQGVHNFGVQVDEGPLGLEGQSVGNYGPYKQSQRKDIYRAVVKELVAQGKAYPCWMSTEELDDLRKMQEASKKVPGVYGQYAKWRDASFEEQKAKIDAGEPFVIRLRAPAQMGDKVKIYDMIRGESETYANFLDHVLLKSTNSLPTYHMAHIVDDHFMRTTHVVRSDERYASLPFHVQLFEVCGFKAPMYAHIAPLCKLDGTTNNKRKLSKRHDPEANVERFFEQGIPVDAIREFLTNIIDPSFEEWQKNNPDKNYRDFIFDIAHMNTSGALFDLTKLEFVSKERLAKIDKETFYEKAVAWAKTFGGTIRVREGEVIAEKQLFELMEKYHAYTFDVLNIERLTEADPKRYHKWSDVRVQIPAFYDEVYEAMQAGINPRGSEETGDVSFIKPSLPEFLDDDRMQSFLKDYVELLDLNTTKDEWFAQLKEIGGQYGFAATNAQFKEGGYIGKIGDLAMRLRVKLLGSKTTPDLYESMKVMGRERVLKRLGR